MEPRVFALFNNSTASESNLLKRDSRCCHAFFEHVKLRDREEYALPSEVIKEGEKPITALCRLMNRLKPKLRIKPSFYEISRISKNGLTSYLFYGGIAEKTPASGYSKDTFQKVFRTTLYGWVIASCTWTSTIWIFPINETCMDLFDANKQALYDFGVVEPHPGHEFVLHPDSTYSGWKRKMEKKLFLKKLTVIHRKFGSDIVRKVYFLQ